MNSGHPVHGDKTLVLVIEDDRLYASYLKELLETRDFDVTLAHDGVEGIAAVRARRPALILTDILMPELDGIELIRAVRDEEHPPPIIAISGGGRVDAEMYLKLALQLGAQRAFRKPVPDETLCDAIGELLPAG